MAVQHFEGEFACGYCIAEEIKCERSIPVRVGGACLSCAKKKIRCQVLGKLYVLVLQAHSSDDLCSELGNAG